MRDHDESLSDSALGEAAGGGRIVEQGECVTSIAYATGLTTDAIWNAPENDQLRSDRADPNVLLPGDRLTIPARRRKDEEAATENRHVFKRTDVPALLRLRLLDMGQPRGNVDYELMVDGHSESGQTDAQGRMEVPVAPDANEAILRVRCGEVVEEYQLAIGHLNPADQASGAQARLLNLGWPLEVDGEIGPATRSALRTFQRAQDLRPTGGLDEATVAKLKEQYGS